MPITRNPFLEIFFILLDVSVFLILLSLDKQRGETGSDERGKGSADERRDRQFGDFRPAGGDEGAEAADHDCQRSEVGESAQGVGHDNSRAF